MDDTKAVISHETFREFEDWWHRCKGGRIAPARQDFEPMEFPHLLPQVFLVDVAHDPLRFRYRLCGTGVAEDFGEDVTGRFLDELDLGDAGKAIAHDYERAVRDRQPVCGRWCYVKDSGRTIEYHRLLLPLSSNGEHVDMLLGVFATLSAF